MGVREVYRDRQAALCFWVYGKTEPNLVLKGSVVRDCEKYPLAK